MTVALSYSTLKQRFLSVWHRLISADFVQKVAQTYATRFLLLFLGTATSVITARILGPEGRGVLAIMSSIALIGIQFGNLGFHGANTFHVARSKPLLPTLIGNSFLIALAIGSSGAFIAWIVFQAWPNLVSLNDIFLILPLIAIPMGLASLFMQNLLLGVQEIKKYNHIEIANNLFSICILVLIACLGFVNVISVYTIGLLGYIVSTILFFISLRPHIKTRPNISFPLLRESFQYGKKAYLSSLFSLLIKRLDLLMISYFLGYKQTGLYAVAIGLINLLYIFPEVIGMIAFPKLCSMKNWDEKVKFTQKVIVLMLAVMLPTSCIVILFAKWVVIFLYGDEFRNATEPLMWFLPGVIVLSIEVMYRRILTSTNYPATIVYGWSLAFMVNLCLNYFLIPKLGISGAAIASSISYFVVSMTTIYLFKIKKNQPLDAV